MFIWRASVLWEGINAERTYVLHSLNEFCEQSHDRRWDLTIVRPFCVCYIFPLCLPLCMGGCVTGPPLETLTCTMIFSPYSVRYFLQNIFSVLLWVDSTSTFSLDTLAIMVHFSFWPLLCPFSRLKRPEKGAIVLCSYATDRFPERSFVLRNYWAEFIRKYDPFK